MRCKGGGNLDQIKRRGRDQKPWEKAREKRNKGESRSLCNCSDLDFDVGLVAFNDDGERGELRKKGLKTTRGINCSNRITGNWNIQRKGGQTQAFVGVGLGRLKNSNRDSNVGPRKNDHVFKGEETCCATRVW